MQEKIVDCFESLNKKLIKTKSHLINIVPSNNHVWFLTNKDIHYVWGYCEFLNIKHKSHNLKTMKFIGEFPSLTSGFKESSYFFYKNKNKIKIFGNDLILTNNYKIVKKRNTAIYELESKNKIKDISIGYNSHAILYEKGKAELFVNSKMIKITKI